MMDDTPDDPLALDLRSGLPEALKVLLADYPRDGWETDPGFDGLIRFWLDRHMMFRRILDRLQADTRGAADGNIAPDLYRAQLSQLGSVFVGELHGHHSIEDMHYFPVLATKDSRLSRGFEILDRDHHALDGHLNAFVAEANDLLAPANTGDPAAFVPTLERLGGFLDRHLTDEEDLIVPVILKHGTGGLG